MCHTELDTLEKSQTHLNSIGKDTIASFLIPIFTTPACVWEGRGCGRPRAQVAPPQVNVHEAEAHLVVPLKEGTSHELFWHMGA